MGKSQPWEVLFFQRMCISVFGNKNDTELLSDNILWVVTEGMDVVSDGIVQSFFTITSWNDNGAL